MPDDLDPILIQITVPLPIPMIYAGLHEPTQLREWLAEEGADVRLKVGGPYVLKFGGDPPFTSTGEVTQFTPDVDVGFSWTGPSEFDALMNRPTPLTHVYFRLQESPEGIDVTLEHSGWRSGDAWEEARSWHFHFWDERLHRLKDYLLKAAYG